MRRPVRNLLRLCAASLAVLAAAMAVFLATRPGPSLPTLRLGFAKTLVRGRFQVFPDDRVAVLGVRKS